MVAIKSKSIDEISAMADQRLPVPGADVAWLVKRVRELEEALKPFSDEASWWFTHNYSASDPVVEGFPGYDGTMTCGDLFRARRALAKADQEDPV